MMTSQTLATLVCSAPTALGSHLRGTPPLWRRFLWHPCGMLSFLGPEPGLARPGLLLSLTMVLKVHSLLIAKLPDDEELHIESMWFNGH